MFMIDALKYRAQIGKAFKSLYMDVLLTRQQSTAILKNVSL